MKLTRRLFAAFGASLLGRRPAAPEIRLQIVNRTRRTQLGTRIEVADRDGKRAKGLLGRKTLAPGEGMWIIPCEAVHTFGMQFSIDLIYLDRAHCIKKIRRAVPPWRISACLAAHSVVELPAGVIESTQTKPGDVLDFSPSLAADSQGNAACTA